MQVIKQVLVNSNNERNTYEYVRLDAKDLIEYKNSKGITKILSYGQLEASAHALVEENNKLREALTECVKIAKADQAKDEEIARLKLQLKTQEQKSARQNNRLINRINNLETKIQVMAHAVADTVDVVNSQIVDV